MAETFTRGGRALRVHRSRSRVVPTMGKPETTERHARRRRKCLERVDLDA